MILYEQNILFFTRTMKLGGTENVVLQLCEIFKPLVNKIVVCSCGGINVKKLNAMGIKHYDIPDIECKSPKTIYTVLTAVNDIIKVENITVIHTHHRMAAFYVTLMRAYKRCCFINTTHITFKNKKCLTRFSHNHARLIACGEMTKKALVDFCGLPNEQVTVIHNAIKPFNKLVTEDSLIQELHKKDCFIVGNIGRLSEEKGTEYYIRAIPDVRKAHPEARFLVIGSGDDEEKLKKLTCDLKIEDITYFLGYRSDIQNLMSQLDLVVLSSLEEGLPLAPIEAFSVGKTIVASAVGGTIEIVEDKKNGLLVEAKQPKQIADSVCWMIEHPIERRSMEENACSKYKKEFSFSNMAEEYIYYYKKIEN